MYLPNASLAQDQSKGACIEEETYISESSNKIRELGITIHQISLAKGYCIRVFIKKEKRLHEQISGFHV